MPTSSSSLTHPPTFLTEGQTYAFGVLSRSPNSEQVQLPSGCASLSLHLLQQHSPWLKHLGLTGTNLGLRILGLQRAHHFLHKFHEVKMMPIFLGLQVLGELRGPQESSLSLQFRKSCSAMLGEHCLYVSITKSSSVIFFFIFQI